jgi:hypothetical protein
MFITGELSYILNLIAGNLEELATDVSVSTPTVWSAPLNTANDGLFAINLEVMPSIIIHHLSMDSA